MPLALEKSTHHQKPVEWSLAMPVGWKTEEEIEEERKKAREKAREKAKKLEREKKRKEEEERKRDKASGRKPGSRNAPGTKDWMNERPPVPGTMDDNVITDQNRVEKKRYLNATPES